MSPSRTVVRVELFGGRRASMPVGKQCVRASIGPARVISEAYECRRHPRCIAIQLLAWSDQAFLVSFVSSDSTPLNYKLSICQKWSTCWIQLCVAFKSNVFSLPALFRPLEAKLSSEKNEALFHRIMLSCSEASEGWRELAHCLRSKCRCPYPFQRPVRGKVWWWVLCSLRNNVSKCCWRSLQAISLQVCPPSWHDILKQAGQEELTGPIGRQWGWDAHAPFATQKVGIDRTEALRWQRSVLADSSRRASGKKNVPLCISFHTVTTQCQLFLDTKTKREKKKTRSMNRHKREKKKL